MAWQCNHSLFLLCNKPATRKECAIDVANKLIDIVIYSYVMRSIARPLITEMAMMDLSHKDMFLSDFFHKLNESKSIQELLLHLSPNENLEFEKIRFEPEEVSEIVSVFNKHFDSDKSQKYSVNESEVVCDEVGSLNRDSYDINQVEELEGRLEMSQNSQIENDEMCILSNLLNNLKIDDEIKDNDKANEGISVLLENVLPVFSDLKNTNLKSKRELNDVVGEDLHLESTLDLDQFENNKETNHLKEVTDGLDLDNEIHLTNLKSQKNQQDQNTDPVLVLTEHLITKTPETELVYEDTSLNEKSLFLPENDPPIFNTRMIGLDNIDTNNYPYHISESCFKPGMIPENDNLDTYANFNMPNAPSDCVDRKNILQTQPLLSSQDTNCIQLSDPILDYSRPTNLPNEEVDLDDDHSSVIENAIKLSEIFSDLFFNSPLQSIIRDQVAVSCDSILGSNWCRKSESLDYNAVNILEYAITGIINNTKELENKIKLIETKTKDEYSINYVSPDALFSKGLSRDYVVSNREPDILIENEIDNIGIKNHHEYMNSEGIKSVSELENKETLNILDIDLVNEIQREKSTVEDIFTNNEPTKFDQFIDNKDEYQFSYQMAISNPNFISTTLDRQYDSVEEEWKQFLKGIDIPESSVEIEAPGVILSSKNIEKINSETQSKSVTSRTDALQYGTDSGVNPNSNSNMEDGNYLDVHLNSFIDEVNLNESSNAKIMCVGVSNNIMLDISIHERNTDNVSDSHPTCLTGSRCLKINSLKTQSLKDNIEESKNSKSLLGKQLLFNDMVGTNYHRRNIEALNEFSVNLDDSTKSMDPNTEISNTIEIFMGKESSDVPLICTDANEYPKLDEMINTGNIDYNNDTNLAYMTGTNLKKNLTNSQNFNHCMKDANLEFVCDIESSKTSSLTKGRVNEKDCSANIPGDLLYTGTNITGRNFIKNDTLNEGLKSFNDLKTENDCVNNAAKVSVTCVLQTDLFVRDLSKPKPLNCKKEKFVDRNASLKPRKSANVNKKIRKTLNPSKAFNSKLDNIVIDTNPTCMTGTKVLHNHSLRSKSSNVNLEDLNDIYVYVDHPTRKDNIKTDNVPEFIICKESSHNVQSDKTINFDVLKANFVKNYCLKNGVEEFNTMSMDLDVSNSRMYSNKESDNTKIYLLEKETLNHTNMLSDFIGNKEEINHKNTYIDKRSDKATLSSKDNEIFDSNHHGRNIQSECDLENPISTKNINIKTRKNEKSQRNIEDVLLVVEVSNNASGYCDLPGGTSLKDIKKETRIIDELSVQGINTDVQKNSKRQSFVKCSVSNKSLDTSIFENLSDLFFNAEESLWRKDEKNLKGNEIRSALMVKPEIRVSNDTQSLPLVDIRYETKDEDILPCETVESIPLTESYGLFPNVTDNIMPTEDGNQPNESIYGIINENINEMQSTSVSLESKEAKQTDKEDTDKVYEKLLNNEFDYLIYINELNLNFDVSKSNIIKTENLYIRKSMLDVFFENEGVDIITKNELIHLFALEETKIVDWIYEKQKRKDVSQSETVSPRNSENESLNKRLVAQHIDIKEKIPEKTFSNVNSINEILNRTVCVFEKKKELKEYSDTKIKSEENKNKPLKGGVSDYGSDNTFKNNPRCKNLQINCCSEYISEIMKGFPNFALVNGSSDDFFSRIKDVQLFITNNQNFSLSEILLAKSYIFNVCWKRVLENSKTMNSFTNPRQTSNLFVLKLKNNFVEKVLKSRLNGIRSISLLRGISLNQKDSQKNFDSSSSFLKINQNLGLKPKTNIKCFVKSVNKITANETRISTWDDVWGKFEHSNSIEQKVVYPKLNYVTITIVWCLSGGICVLSFFYTIFLLMDREHVQEHWT